MISRAARRLKGPFPIADEDNVRAQLRVLLKRILGKHGYPSDKQEKTMQTVLEQAEVLSAEWAVA